MPTFAILPIKRFDRAKQRLRKGLAQAAVSELVQTMFEDVLSSLERTSELEQILVVTSDPQAKLIARDHDATVIDDDERGHNTAAQRGIAHALGANAHRTLLVPRDCPLHDRVELDALIS